MKNQSAVTSMLGLSQHEIAALSKVSRSQWSMFESGKRSLPTQALQLLAEILAHIQSPKAIGKAQSSSKEERIQTQRQLERLLHENEYQQLRLDRKIAAANKKRQAKSNLLRLAEFLAKRDSKNSIEKCLYNAIALKAEKANTNALSADLLAIEIKKETLEFENGLLKERIHEISKRK